MIWNSVGDFFAMGGYGLYVWGSFGACVLAFLAEPLLIRMRHSEIVRTLRRQAAAEKLEMENK
ncbi:MAG TPA: heme exporter protein CcmD [Rhodoferax sp.]|jgi:heme exporter protein D|nr:heme exporter protein CcmD [Rhodoferax sp.]HNV59663.1 heme exporter protein CcmD [Rhodoferax sp.]HPW29254.1 heme exporter protein CcmD [Rhodoferax sp.]